MGRWLNRLREAEKNTETPLPLTDKTDKTPPERLLSVLSVPPRAVSNFFSDDSIAPEPLPLAKPFDIDELSPEDRIAAFEERAGILEFDEHLPRDEAERLAREQIRFLH